jgi:hypothetical protein
LGSPFIESVTIHERFNEPAIISLPRRLLLTAGGESLQKEVIDGIDFKHRRGVRTRLVGLGILGQAMNSLIAEVETHGRKHEPQENRHEEFAVLLACGGTPHPLGRGAATGELVPLLL